LELQLQLYLGSSPAVLQPIANQPQDDPFVPRSPEHHARTCCPGTQGAEHLGSTVPDMGPWGDRGTGQLGWETGVTQSRACTRSGGGEPVSATGQAPPESKSTSKSLLPLGLVPAAWQCQRTAPSSGWTSRWLQQSPRRTSPGCPSNTLKKPSSPVRAPRTTPPAPTTQPSPRAKVQAHKPVPAAWLEQPPTAIFNVFQATQTSSRKGRLAHSPTGMLSTCSLPSSHRPSMVCALQGGFSRLFPPAGESPGKQTWVSSNPKSRGTSLQTQKQPPRLEHSKKKKK